MRWSDLGEPVEIGGIVVRTGDLVHGDYGGCVAIPKANHPWIVDACSLVLDFEKRAHIILRRTDLPSRGKGVLVDELVASHRQSIEEVRQWCREAGLEIEREVEEEAGITIIARRY